MTINAILRGANVFIPDAAPELTGIVLTVRMWNTAEPTFVVDFSLTIEVEGHQPVKAQLTDMPETLRLNGESSTVLTAGMSLERKSAATPLGAAPMDGTLLFYAKIKKADVLRPSTVLKMTILDGNNQKHIVAHEVKDWL
jgi:hypothetical protein